MNIKNVETLKFKCIGVVGAIDVHGKTVALHIETGSVKKDGFMRFLDKLAVHNQSRKCYLFVDNLRMHYTKDVVNHARNLNMQLIYNAPYSSEFNPIERLWCYAKRNFSKYMIGITDYRKQSVIIDLVRLSI